MSRPAEKLRWEGTPLYAQDVKSAAGCSGVFTGLVAVAALVYALLEPARYPWPAPLVATLIGVGLVAAVARAARRTRYRITTGSLTVERIYRTTRYLIPRDVELELRDSHDGCVHLGELPAEIHDKRGVRHTTEPLLLTGLGSDAPAILGALDAARTDETYPPATVESTPHAPSHVKDLCASRAPVPLPAFVAATPPEVPPAVARAVRGCVARECGVPVDFVGPGDSVRGFMRKRDYVDFTSFLLAVGSALGQEFRATGGSTAVQSPDGTLDEETWLDLTVVELAAAITRGRRPPGARPGR